MKKLISTALICTIALMSFSVIGSSAVSDREVITAFNFDNTGKTAGDTLDEYETESGVYSATMGSGILQHTTLTWTDTAFVDENNNEVGMLPAFKNYCRLKADTKGYQNIEISFDVGYYNEKGDSIPCNIFLYSNNYHQMQEYYNYEIPSSNKLNHCKISLKGSYLELENDTYSELYLDINCTNMYINNIEVTGAKIDEADGRKYVCGDANEDGKITVADCTLLQKYLTELDGMYIGGSPYCYCKVNDDFKLTVADITCIQKYLAGFRDGIGKTGEEIY